MAVARAAYDALTADQKALVAKADQEKLTRAGTQVASAKQAAAEAAKAQAKAKADQSAADAVISKISALPSSVSASDTQSVTQARQAYNSLTAEQKKLVSSASLSKLSKAEKQILSELEKLLEDEKKNLAQAAYEETVEEAGNAKVSGPKAKAKKKKKAAVTWKAVEGCSGYQIQYSKDKKFKKSVKKLTVKGGDKTSATLKKLKPKKITYIRIRSFTKITDPNGKTITVYGKWSKRIKVKAKK